MNKIKILTFVSLMLLIQACTISYKFNGASIDYSKIKTISIALFPNESPEYINPTLSQQFTEGLKDFYQRQTRLRLVPEDGDLQLEGEITGYKFTPQAIKADATAAQTRLQVSVKVRFYNNKDSEQDFESTFSAYGDFDSMLSQNDAETDLLPEILDQIYESIFNKSVANW